MQKRLLKTIFETIFVLLLLSSLFSIPFISCYNETPKVDHGITRYYEQAVVKESYETGTQNTIIEQCYVSILHVVLLFFGNSILTANLFQISLWVITAALLYLLIRWISDREISLTSLAVFTCICFIRRDLHFLHPVVLIVFVAAVLFLLFVGILKKRHRKAPEENIEPEIVVEKAEEALPQESNQIPNVLPGPKKHVRRNAVDFSYSVSPELLHFDLEPGEMDDYDL